jgi:hypothetical protein
VHCTGRDISSLDGVIRLRVSVSVHAHQASIRPHNPRNVYQFRWTSVNRPTFIAFKLQTLTSISWSNAISNLITDLTIFILPMPVIFKLNMSTGSRVGLVILFSLGFFICLTTALRMATLPLTLNTKHPTYESAPTNIWSFIEAAVGVICACLISLRKSIGALWPTRWRSNKGTNSGRYHTYGSARSGPRGLATPRGALVRNSKAFALEDMKTGGKIVTDTCLDVSPSESQERIIGEGKTSTRVTTDRLRSESLSESEDVGLQGITVTTDVKIERH